MIPNRDKCSNRTINVALLLAGLYACLHTLIHYTNWLHPDSTGQAQDD